MILDAAALASFWSKVDRSGGPNACWPWLASVSKGGYGHFTEHFKGKQFSTHKLAWMLKHGPVPKGKVVRHFKCDYKICCNDRHMKIGTHKQNSEDMVRKGRQATGDRSGSRLHPESRPRGEQHHATTLTERGVRLIRAVYRRGIMDGVALALKHGVHKDTIKNIVNRKTWGHVL